MRARTINSENRDDWDAVREAIDRDEVDLLLISPERFNNPAFRDDVLPDGGRALGPARDRRGPLHQRLGPRLPARLPAARPRPRAAAARRPGPVHHRDRQRPRDRRHPRAARRRARHPPRPARAREPRAVDARHHARSPSGSRGSRHVVPGLEGSGVIYVLTVADTTRVASFLRTQGIDAHAYSGETEPERRLELEEALIGNGVKALVATSALGMGFDKPDLGFVIHYQSPGLADRLLPAGRPRRPRPAARAGRPAARHGGPRHPGLLHRLGVPAAHARRGGRRAARGPSRARERERDPLRR